MKLLKPILAGVVVLGGILFFSVFGLRGCASQSGMFSRWTGSAVELPIPEDCVRIINFGNTGKTKYLSYVNSKGEVMLREYSDYGVQEALYTIDGGKFTTDLMRVTVAPEKK